MCTEHEKKKNVTYILRCSDDSLYTGWTNDIESRLRAHNAGQGAKYTRCRRPVELVYLEEFDSKQEAMSREARIKQLSRKDKLKLIEEWSNRREDNMEIRDCYQPTELTQMEPFQKILRNGQTEQEFAPVITEHQLLIFVNDTPLMRVVCTPDHLKELVLGRLLSEGIILGTDDVEVLYLCETGHQAKVFLKKNIVFEKEKFEKVATCCTNNTSFVSVKEERALQPLPEGSWTPEWVFQMADVFAKGSPLHKQTVGTHSCMLAKGGTILCSMEDIGRHNALDKVIGYALLQKIPLKDTMVYTSGRVPVDMTEKVIRAGIPVLVSKAVPTQQSIHLAKEYGLTLITSARPDMAKQFT